MNNAKTHKHETGTEVVVVESVKGIVTRTYGTIKVTGIYSNDGAPAYGFHRTRRETYRNGTLLKTEGFSRPGCPLVYEGCFEVI